MLSRSLVGLLLIGTLSRSAVASEGMPQTAFWLEARLAAGTAVAGTAVLGGNNFSVPILQPSLVVGARILGRLHLGLGFSFFRTASTATSFNTFTLQPTFAVDLIKSADSRVAFFVRGGLPMGAAVVTNNPNLFVIGYDASLGVRYAPHPMFAVGLEGGLMGTFIDPGSRSTGLGVQSVYGALSGNFFYGK